MTRTTPRGPTPSLIGGANGRPKRAKVLRLSECFRCHHPLVKDTTCIEIPKLGGAYSTDRRVCDDCYQAIIAKTESDLAVVKAL